MKIKKSAKGRSAGMRSGSSGTINKIRAFNRYYTGLIGVLNKQFLNSHYSLPEARILYEINSAGKCTSRDIIEKMNIDAGYLSRILNNFSIKNLVKKMPDKKDRRVIYISLTVPGKKLYKKLTEAQVKRVYGLISGLGINERKKLVWHMEGIKRILWKKYSVK
ncbi:MAG TPA: MarR family transcriptional regulator [Ignavibacteria bacterium]|nr:MarR family transcriptional regulator [Ignavibacteria bacterium]HMQ97653.1 MarR family transcriptional regulator [Ignavibacteria bacterium]